MTKSITRDYEFRDNKFVSARRKVVTAASNAATMKGKRVQITSESLSTAAAATYTLTLTNPSIKADSLVLASVQLGGSTAGTPAITSVTPAAGSVVVIVKNTHAANAFNGSIIIDVLVINNSPAQ